MSQPIPVRVTRYACPHCARSHSSRRRAVDHMGRCWRNPAARGCKTCRFFESDWEGYGDECAAGEDLSGRPECGTCVGGYLGIGWDSDETCPDCGGDPEPVKPGPIVGCPKWEPADFVNVQSPTTGGTP